MTEPISLAQAKEHLRVDFDDEDDGIGSAITDARVFIEEQTGLVLSARSVVEVFNGFDGALALRSWPVTAITNISYLDPSAASVELDGAGYRLVAVKKPARIAPVGFWPRTLGHGFGQRGGAVGAVTVTAEAGYATPDDIPATVIRAMKLMIGHFYTNRSAVEAGARAAAVEMPMAVALLLRRYMVKAL